jgi:hypothetical protein
MKPAQDLAALVQQRTWDKDLVLWLGSEDSLHKALSKARVEVFDLLDLFNPDHLPMDEEETRDEMLHGLRQKLQAIQVGPARRTVLLVKSIGLLAKYDAGVKEFYEWFCSDFGMVVLALDGVIEDLKWPDEVVCDSNRLIKYFTESERVKEVYGEEG